MVCEWELRKAKSWTTEQIKNYIWAEVSRGQPVPGCVSVEALWVELLARGEAPYGNHNT